MLRSAAVLSLAIGVQASFEPIGAYQPASQVTDHNALDQDQAAIEAALNKVPVAYGQARSVYTEGGNSRAISVLTIPALAIGMSKGVSVEATGEDGNPVSGAVWLNADQGSTQISVLYDVSDVQANHVRCRVGGLPVEFQRRDGCIDTNKTVVIGGRSMQATMVEHISGRDIEGFSTSARARMWECSNGCPYAEYSSFYDYYGTHTYADQWVKGAIDGINVAYPKGRGSADFSRFNDDDTRVEAIKKGTVYLNIWMYVVREFEDAVGDCEDSCIGCNDDPVHAWDEGVAFYTGSLVRPQTTVDPTMPLFEGGNLLWTLNDKRCANFKTCGANGDSTTGTAKVNLDLATQFAIGQHDLRLGQCAAGDLVKDRVVNLMRIGLIQGTLRYAYIVGELEGTEKERAEGAVFAAGVLPALHKCSATAATAVYDNMKLGASSTSMAAVKRAFEVNYECLGITCADVGGLWFGAINDYYPGAAPCKDASTGNSPLPVGGIVGIVIAILVAIILLVLLCVVVRRERAGKPLFLNMEKMRT